MFGGAYRGVSAEPQAASTYWDPSSLPAPRGRLRASTLISLRWLGLAGQLAAVLVTALLFDFEIRLGWALGVIGAGAWMNLALLLRPNPRPVLEGWGAAAQLSFDVLQLGALLGLTGGLDNPFCLLLIAPVTIAAAALPTRQTMTIGVLALLVASILFFVPEPLPWRGGEQFALPPLYRLGVWIAVMTGVLFTAGYAWRTANEARRMALALAATDSILAREQRLAAMGGLAAAAAHELGTPLATIQIVARELLRNAKGDAALAEDAALLVQQAERCRDILKALSQRSDTGEVADARLSLKMLLNECAEPHRGAGPRIEIAVEGAMGAVEPEVRRLPEAVRAISTLIENATDFAVFEVRVTARYDDRTVRVEVRDDGPGFASDVLARLGEPYVTSRPLGEGSRTGHQGMGLGFFIAKTLLEKTGASLMFGNLRNKEGAQVTITWPREAIEAPQLDAKIS